MSLDLTTNCWEHPSLDADGYARISTSIDSARLSTSWHRYFYETFVGPVPDGLELDHVCRNRSCCNPDHLEPVTSGRNHRRGERAKLTEATVAEAISRYQAGGVTFMRLASDYGVSYTTMRYAMHGKTWKGTP